MTNTIKLLTVTLIAQTVLIAYLYAGKQSFEAYQSNQSLLGVVKDQVTGISIVAKNGDKVVLKKEGQNWVLPEKDNFPVDNLKVKNVLDNLLALNKPFPIGRTANAAEQFGVADGMVEKTITYLNQDKELAALYLGNSPGYKKIYVRPRGDDSTYSVNFSSYQASATEENWYNKSFLKIPPEEIAEIHVNGLVLKKDKAGYHVEGAQEGFTPNESKLKKTFNDLAKLSINRPLGVDPELGKGKAIVEYTLVTTGGEQLQFSVTEREGAKPFTIKRSNSPFYLSVGRPKLEALAKLKLEDLLEKVGE